MHVSRNKCELIAECCITGVQPTYDVCISDNDIRGSVTVKGIDITSIEPDYCYIQSRYNLACSINDLFKKTDQVEKIQFQRKYFENATQMFYLALNEGLTDLKLVDRTEEELEQIRKYRELEEDLAYV